MKNLNINPMGLKGNQINERMKELMGISTINENTTKSAVELIRSRLDGNEELISDALIKDVYAKSESNTRRFLENMEDVCRKAILEESDTVSKENVADLGKRKLTPSQSQKRDANLIAFYEVNYPIGEK